jgi:4-hydroxybenzoate polyprenyltransferase
MTRLTALIALARPHHWMKSGFVLAGPVFGHAWQQPDTVAACLLAVAAFSLAASSVYIGNDWADREQDRQHPIKRFRPLAAGAVSLRTAIAAMILLACTALGLGWLASGPVAAIVAIYLAMNVAYSASWKRIVILDVFIVASGFVLRILAGTLGIGIPPSHWLLLCAFMLALFLGFAKRRAEMTDRGKSSRKVLQHYTVPLLDQLTTITATTSLISYTMYTVNAETIRIHGTGNLVYTLPLVAFGIFRFLERLQSGHHGGDMAADLVSDRYLGATVLIWITVTWLLIQ